MTTKPKIRLYKSFKSLDAGRKIILFISIALMAAATIVLIALNSYFNELGWATSKWLILSYSALLATSLFVVLNYKSLYKISRLPILAMLILIFAGSTYASADVYIKSLEFSGSNKTINEIDTYSTPPTDASVDIIEPQTTESPQSNNNHRTNETSCYEDIIPYETVERPAIWLYVGEREISNRGVEGKKLVCFDAAGNRTEEIISPAFDEYVNVGTKERETNVESPTVSYTYEEALAIAKQICQQKIPAGSWDSTDMSDCKNDEMAKLGH